LTVLSDPAVAELGAALYAARRSGVPIEPLTDSHAAMSVADAYRVQRDLVARLLADGDRVVGYKLGLTSAPMQRLFGTDSPDLSCRPSRRHRPACGRHSVRQGRRSDRHRRRRGRARQPAAGNGPGSSRPWRGSATRCAQASSL
jgi:hypothetical protein